MKNNPSSICTRLSESEKERTIDALCRASERIRKRIIKIDFDDNEILQNARWILLIDKINNKHLDMLLRLTIGHSQQPFRKRVSRKLIISGEAARIAKETGAEAQEIEETLLALMQDYIR